MFRILGCYYQHIKLSVKSKILMIISGPQEDHLLGVVIGWLH